MTEKTKILIHMLEKMNEIAKMMEDSRQFNKKSHTLLLEKLDKLKDITEK